MRQSATLEAVGLLQEAGEELRSLVGTTEAEIRTAAGAFEDLTRHTDSILGLAGNLVASVESESIRSVLPTVQALGDAAQRFVTQRLDAISGIVGIVQVEIGLLRQLSNITREQADIARKTKALSVLTNIEVARLGGSGDSFGQLAGELAEFSQVLSEDIQRLAFDTDTHRRSTATIGEMLASELPRQREALGRTENDIARALNAAQAGVEALSRVPQTFRDCVSSLGVQISGVITAVQQQDMTRQKIEHVQQAFVLICDRIREDERDREARARASAWACAGLAIQTYQIQKIGGDVEDWSSQIKRCMAGILQISASGVAGIGPLVLQQEREVSSQLAQIDEMHGESRQYSQGIHQTLGGLSNLMQLVRGHLRKSKAIRNSLQLLTFNSIIEATHLGSQANAILAIARHIDSISADWRRIMEQAEGVMAKLLQLVEPAQTMMRAFSEESGSELREAQSKTRSCLETLRGTAESAASQAAQMQAATERMRSEIARVDSSSRVLEGCFDRFEEVRNRVERAGRELESSECEWRKHIDPGDVEAQFSASYTTEIEREVLQAALRGGPLPATQHQAAGNRVEIF
jgi:ElaB/YqjD/DUF883 family membrane-anchored ribosome-binding protein